MSGSRLGCLYALLAMATRAAPGADEPANLALGKPTTQSSVYGGTGQDQGSALAVDGITDWRENPFNWCHTALEDQPWWQVDLEAVYRITNVVVYNRVLDGDPSVQDRARTLRLLFSLDGQTWDLVYTDDGERFSRLNVEIASREARYVRVQLGERNYLHLREVEVYGVPVAPGVGQPGPAPADNGPLRSLRDGPVQVLVPESLALGDAALQVRPLTELPKPLPSGLAAAGGYELSLGDQHEFALPLTIELPLSREQVDPELPAGRGVGAARWDDDTQRWLDLPARYDAERQVLRLWTNHLSTFAYWTLRGYLYVTSPAEHFYVYYRPTVLPPLQAGGFATARDAAQEVALYLDDAWERYEQAGFTMPSVGGELGAVFEQVGLGGRQVMVDAILVEAEPEPYYSGLSRNLMIACGSPYASRNELHHACAHELFHRIENCYVSRFTNMAPFLWWIEMMADAAASGIACPDLGETGLNPFVNGHFREPMTYNNDVHAYPYARMLLALTAEGVDLTELWEASAASVGYLYGGPLPGIERYVQDATDSSLPVHWTTYSNTVLFAAGSTMHADRDGTYLVPNAVGEQTLLGRVGNLTRPASATITLNAPGSYSAACNTVFAGSLTAGPPTCQVAVRLLDPLPPRADLQVFRLPGSRLPTQPVPEAMLATGTTAGPFELRNASDTRSADVLVVVLHNAGPDNATVRVLAELVSTAGYLDFALLPEMAVVERTDGPGGAVTNNYPAAQRSILGVARQQPAVSIRDDGSFSAQRSGAGALVEREPGIQVEYTMTVTGRFSADRQTVSEARIVKLYRETLNNGATTIEERTVAQLRDLRLAPGHPAAIRHYVGGEASLVSLEYVRTEVQRFPNGDQATKTQTGQPPADGNYRLVFFDDQP